MQQGFIEIRNIKLYFSISSYLLAYFSRKEEENFQENIGFPINVSCRGISSKSYHSRFS